MVTEESRVAGSNIMVGSTLICKAESLEKVWEVVKADPYWKQGVVSAMNMWPYEDSIDVYRCSGTKSS